MSTDFATKRPPSSPLRRTMQAARIAGPGQIVEETVELPLPGPGEVRVRLEGCGLCASNLPVFEGRPWFEYPLEPGAPGHEGWGVIEEVGPEVEDLQIGSRVACLSYHAFAEYDLAPADHVVPLPDNLKTMPVPGEPLGCAFNILDRSDLRPGQTVAILGIGFLGALLVALAKKAGARVLAVSRRPFALDIARQMGADEVIPFESTPGTASQIFSLTEDAGCERVIEAAGCQPSLSLAEEIIAVRGRLVVAGYHQDQPRQVNMQQWNWRGIDVINAHERDPQVYIAGIRRAVAAVSEGVLDPTPLYSHSFPREDLAAAMERALSRPEGFLKALILNDV